MDESRKLPYAFSGLDGDTLRKSWSEAFQEALTRSKKRGVRYRVAKKQYGIGKHHWAAQAINPGRKTRG